MKTILASFSLLLSIIITSYSQQTTITVNGKISDFDGEKVYAKKVDLFKYKSDTVIDSAVVSVNGAFTFSIKESLPMVINFSTNAGQHPIHGILRESPELYFYGFCAMLYVPEPTLYISESGTLDLDWTVKEQLDSIIITQEDNNNYNTFHDYYLKEDVSNDLYLEDGNFKALEIEDAWTIIENNINETLKKCNASSESVEHSFENYMYSEIILGGINNFLNWFEFTHGDYLKTSFENNNLPPIYINAIKKYANNNWNRQSVEFYKMTERYVNYHLNKENKTFEGYYPISDAKIAVANDELEPSIAKQYVDNLKK